MEAVIPCRPDPSWNIVGFREYSLETPSASLADFYKQAWVDHMIYRNFEDHVDEILLTPALHATESLSQYL